MEITFSLTSERPTETVIMNNDSFFMVIILCSVWMII
jgi:hypothetical protein